jgi:hypothetical protein
VLSEDSTPGPQRVVPLRPGMVARVGLFGKVTGSRSAPTLQPPHQLEHRYSFGRRSVRESVTPRGPQRLHPQQHGSPGGGPRCSRSLARRFSQPAAVDVCGWRVAGSRFRFPRAISGLREGHTMARRRSVTRTKRPLSRHASLLARATCGPTPAEWGTSHRHRETSQTVEAVIALEPGMVGLGPNGGVVFTRFWDQIAHAAWSAPRLVVLYGDRGGDEFVVRVTPRSSGECDEWVRFLDAKGIHLFAPVFASSVRRRRASRRAANGSPANW